MKARAATDLAAYLRGIPTPADLDQDGDVDLDDHALFASCLGTAFLIRYKSSDLRWGARILFCILPAMVGLYFLAKELGMLG